MTDLEKKAEDVVEASVEEVTESVEVVEETVSETQAETPNTEETPKAKKTWKDYLPKTASLKEKCCFKKTCCSSESDEDKSKFMKWELFAAYILLLIPLVAPQIVAGFLAYRLRSVAQDTVYLSHINKIVRLFVVSVVGLIVGCILTCIYIGWLVLLGLAVYVVFYVVTGLIRLHYDHVSL